MELKPCPFCGEEAEILGHQCTDALTEYSATCTNCKTESNWHLSEYEAIESWNTRAPLPDTNVGNKWHKYPEVKPEESGYYLIMTIFGICINKYDKEIELFQDGLVMASRSVSHWRPLPAPPEEVM